MIYFDSAATSYLKPDSVKTAVMEAMNTCGNSGRGAHAPTLNASRVIYKTRCDLAQLIHAEDPTRIAFTMNATQSLNIAIKGLFSAGDHVITSVCEHNSVLRPLYQLEKQGVELSILPADRKGRLGSSTQPADPKGRLGSSTLPTDPKGRLGSSTLPADPTGLTEPSTQPADTEYCTDQTNAKQASADSYGELFAALESCLRPNTKAVVITHASNLTGNVTDLAQVAAFTRKHHLLLLVDASQTIGAWPIDVQADGIDVLCFAGHKSLLGPQGTGGIYVRSGIELKPLLVGGSGILSYSKEHPSVMPTALEAGTLNSHGIAGLGAGVLHILETGVSNIHKDEMKLAHKFISGVRSIPGYTLYGDPDSPLHVATVSLNYRDEDSAVLADWLWENYEICTRSGAHCAPLMHQALGTEHVGAVRFSFSQFNTEEEVDIALQALREFAE